MAAGKEETPQRKKDQTVLLAVLSWLPGPSSLAVVRFLCAPPPPTLFFSCLFICLFGDVSPQNSRKAWRALNEQTICSGLRTRCLSKIPEVGFGFWKWLYSNPVYICKIKNSLEFDKRPKHINKCFKKVWVKLEGFILTFVILFNFIFFPQMKHQPTTLSWVSHHNLFLV